MSIRRFDWILIVTVWVAITIRVMLFVLPEVEYEQAVLSYCRKHDLKYFGRLLKNTVQAKIKQTTSKHKKHPDVKCMYCNRTVPTDSVATRIVFRYKINWQSCSVTPETVYCCCYCYHSTKGHFLSRFYNPVNDTKY